VAILKNITRNGKKKDFTTEITENTEQRERDD